MPGSFRVNVRISQGMSARPQVVVSGGFDDLRARHVRLLEEAAKLGELTVLLWPDETLQCLTGRPPKFPLAERLLPPAGRALCHAASFR